MVSAADMLAAPTARPQHRRNKSASNILKSIMTPKHHGRAPNNFDSPASPPVMAANFGHDPFSMPLLPPNHPHAGPNVLGELRNHNSATPPKLPPKDEKDKRRGLVKKTKSSVSLHSLAKDKDKKKPSKEDERSRDAGSPKKVKKTKSTTNLTGLLSKSKPREKEESRTPARDQENTTPPQSAATPVAHTPIWAEFSTQSAQEVKTTTKVPLNDARTYEEEIALYTPTNYSPSKQRNFHGPFQPTLVNKHALPRPKSAQIVNNITTSAILDTITRRVSSDRERPATSNRASAHVASRSDETQPRKSSWERVINRKSCDEPRKMPSEQAKPTAATTKRGGRVMAVVAAFNSKAKESQKEVPLDPKKIDSEFEIVLESRNIPADLRPKMRALTTRVKADFIKSHLVDSDASSPAPQSAKTSSSKSSFAKVASTRKRSGEHARVSPTSSEEAEASHEREVSGNTKSARPRSRTFTFGKGEKRDPSPSKKNKHERSTSSKSIVVPASPIDAAMTTPGNRNSFFARTPKAAVPEEFVSYLRKTQKPEEVEVGRLHKLRLLLRNETVAWVDCFIEQGGMTEIIELLHRIMKVEWR